MAHLTTDHEMIHVSFPIQKFEEDSDGNLIVTGTVTDGTVDSDRQIVDPAWSGKALTAWMETGPNVRVMHSPALYPAGRGLQVELGDNTHTLKALVVEDTAKKLVRNKVLRAYSVGVARPVIKPDPTGRAPGGIVVGGELAEVSLVDRPANKNCQLVLAKAADSTIPWTYGDLDALLAKAEKDDAMEPDLVKDDTPDDDGKTVVDPQEPGTPDDDSAPGSEADEDDDAVKAYAAAVTLHKAAEPGRDGLALSGTDYLRKAASWQRWATTGEDTGLDGTATGFQRWLAKRNADMSKDITLTSPDPAGLAPYNLAGAGTATTKGAGKTCKGCGKSYHSDSKLRRCENCGKKLPKGDMEKGAMPAGVHPAGPHREPDGDLMELFEQQAGMPSDDDGPEVHDTTPASLKGIGEAYVVKRTHDVLCAAYAWDTVVETYPALKGVGDVCEPDWWTDQAGEALAKGDMPGVAFLAGVAHAAGQLYEQPAVVLDDTRADIRKMFTDAHPMANPHPSGTVTPGQFQRPYLSAGHAAQNAASRGPSQAPPAPHGITADDFNRPLLTAGHEAASPGDRAGNNPTGSVASGSGRALYASAAKAATESAMKAMHDHLAGTFPDMCPMAPSAAVMPPQMQAGARPMAAAPLNVPAAPGEKSELAALVKSARKAAKKAERAAAEAQAETLMKGATSVDVAEYEATIAALKAQIDELGSQPDPAQAPLRGVVGKAASPDSGASVVEKRSLIVEAQEAAAAAEAAEYLTYLRMMSKSANPTTREDAEDRLSKLLK